MKLQKFKITFLLLFFHCKSDAIEYQSEEKKLNIDIIVQSGYINFYQFKNNNKNKLFNNYLSGFQLSGVVLNSLIKTPIGYPVIGFGLHYVRTYGSENALGEDINTATYYKLSSLLANAYVGFKFIPAKDWRIYLLGNMGRGLRDHLKMNGIYSTKFYNSNQSSNIYVNNHYYFGGSMLTSYELGWNMSLGLGLFYNRHILNYSGKYYDFIQGYEFNSNIPKNKLYFNELSASLALIYSL